MNIPRNIRASYIPAGGDITLSVNVGEEDLYIFVRLTPDEAKTLAAQLRVAAAVSEGHGRPGNTEAGESS